MWYDRIVVAGPVPWYWIVAISIFVMAIVCGLLLCACNHKTEWKNTFNELFVNAAHHDKEHRDRIRDITSKKNFGPSKALVHRFSKADQRSDRVVLPPDPRLTIERARRAGLDSIHGSPVVPTIMYPGDKQIDIVNFKNEHSGRMLPTLNHADDLNGNTVLPNMPLQSGRRPEEEYIEMTSFPDSRHLLSTDENHDSAVDSASLVTAYSQEFTVPTSEPQKRRRLKNLGDFQENSSNINDVYGKQIGASDIGGYDNKGAKLGSNYVGFVAEPELVRGTLHDDIDALTPSSTSASVATTLGRYNRGSIDSTQFGQPLLAKQRFSDDLRRAASGHPGSEIDTSNLPPIDSNSSWSSSVPQTQLTDSVSVSKVGIGSPPMSEMTTSWASSVVKDRPVSARTKWSDETNSDSVYGDMALENCDYSSDTSESYHLEA